MHNTSATKLLLAKMIVVFVEGYLVLYPNDIGVTGGGSVMST